MEKSKLPAMTADKAHVTSAVMLAFGILLALLGFNDISVDQLTSDLQELGQLILTIIMPPVIAWVTTYATPNRPKP